MGLIFAALCLIKCGILFDLRKELFQIHWRATASVPNWANDAVFCAFAMVVGLNIWAFGEKCAAAGVKQLRAGLLLVASLSSLFLLLTFHEGDRNYLSPVLNGILSVQSVWSYLSLNLFFRAPFLAAWMLGLGALYYLLFRTRRERLMVPFLAVAATAYLILNLGEFAYFRSELLVLIALGSFCFVFARKANQALHWSAAFAPVVLMACFFALFSPYDRDIGRPLPEFLILSLSVTVVFAGTCLLAARRGIYSSWSWHVPVAITAFLILVSANFPLSINYRQLLMNGITLPRYFLGELLFAGGLLILSALLSRYRPGTSFRWLDVLGLVALVLAIVDWRLVQIMGVRLDWQVLKFGDSPRMMWRLAKPYLPMLALALAGVVFGYYLLLRALGAGRRSPWVGGGRIPVSGCYALGVVALLAFVGAAVVQVDKAEGQVMLSLVKSSPWWKRISEPMLPRDKFMEEARELGMASMLAPHRLTEARTPRDLNVLLIFQESTYNQHLSLFGGTNETQPLLSQYQERMELFPNFFSNFAGSIHARFATFTGLYPVEDFTKFTKDVVPVKSIFEALGDRGYDCSVFYSSFFDYTNFRDLMRSHGVHHLYDADSMPGTRTTEPVAWGLKEEETLAAIRAQIRQYSKDQTRFFMTYVPAAPHNPFDGTPAQFKRYKSEYLSDLTPAYLNELLYMDWVIASIVDELRDTGLLEHTLVVITSDHGEMLGGKEGEPIGHGWRVTPELANVPLIIMDPAHAEGGRVNPAIGSQVDLLPTILDLLNIPLPDGQLYQGWSLYAKDKPGESTAYLNSFRQYASVRGNTIVCGDREIQGGPGLGASWITNRDAKTIFMPLSDPEKPLDMDRFDRFQESFLAHYLEYSSMVRQQPSVE